MRSKIKTRLNADQLHYARLWLWLGIVMVATVVLLSLIDPPTSVKHMLLHDKVMHGFVYACMMGWFAQIFRDHFVRLLLVVVFVGLGIGVEYLQGLLPAREFEYLDMLANAAGVLLAWLLSYTFLGYSLVWFERACLRKAKFSG